MGTLLDQASINSIVTLIGDTIGDNSIGGVSITYRMTGTTVSTWDPVAPTIPAMYTVFSGVSAFKGSFNEKDIEESGGMIEVGDVKFIIMNNSVTGILSVDDQIYEAASAGLHSATTYEVKHFNRDPLNLCYFLAARAV